MTADDLPRLTLKWAFGLPGASSAGTQPVVAGGRLYIATAEGELYVLDAKTGCVHWTLEVEAAVRSAITLEQRTNGDARRLFRRSGRQRLRGRRQGRESAVEGRSG